MFSNLFEARRKDISNLIKLGDSLGRSLRENVFLFRIDSLTNTVSYITENNKIITGTYSMSPTLKIKGITLESMEEFMDSSKFNGTVDGKISDFISNIYTDKLNKAGDTFSEILSLWENRVKFERVQKRLLEKKIILDGAQSIVKEEAYLKFKELRPQVIEFLTKNKEKVSKVSEVNNAATLCNSVAKAFDIPKIKIETLVENKEYTFKEVINEDIYSIICKQELIKKELLENKTNFDFVWATNSKIRNLASLMFGEVADIEKALVEALVEIPYLALVSKKKLTETFLNIIELGNKITVADVQEYSSLIFEMKKDVRSSLITTLNEKYGVNILNLKEPVSFNSLRNTEIVIFETLAKLSPKNSVQKEVLTGVAKLLENRSGIECLDVADDLDRLFKKSGIKGLLKESSLSRYLDFERIAHDLGEVGNVLKLIKQRSSELQNPLQQAAPVAPAMPAQTPPNSPAGETPGGPELPPNDAVGPENDEQGIVPMGGGGAPPPAAPLAPPVDMGQNELMSTMKELEELMANLKVDLMGDGDGTEGVPEDDFATEDGMEGIPGEEGEEGGDLSIDTGDGDDELHIDNVDGEHNMEGDEEGEEKDFPAPKKKGESSKKPPPKKGGKDKPSAPKKGTK